MNNNYLSLIFFFYLYFFFQSLSQHVRPWESGRDRVYLYLRLSRPTPSTESSRFRHITQPLVSLTLQTRHYKRWESGEEETQSVCIKISKSPVQSTRLFEEVWELFKVT